MTKFIYEPTGAEAKVWDFDPTKLLSPEVMAIERLTGMTFGQWTDALWDQSMTAIHALVWVLLKRETPTLRPEQVQFSMSEIDIDIDADEAAEMLERLESIPQERVDMFSEQERAEHEQSLAGLREKVAAAGVSDEAPKEIAPPVTLNGEPTISGRSPTS